MRKHPRNFWATLLLACIGAIALGVIGAALYSSMREAAPIADDTDEPRDNNKHGGPIVITTMTHMEGNFRDDVDEDLFLRHVEQMRWAMDLFDEYGAKLTFESEASFAEANTNWDVNILKEVVDAGHGVGTHADFGATGTELTLPQLTERFKANKELVDDLVGAENNHGVSGGTGPTDWVLAASRAGFAYMDALTGFGYLSMPLGARPDDWTDGYIRNVAYHDSIPVEFEDRLSPLDLKDARDLEPDADAALTVMTGDVGELASLSEGRSTCFPDCELTQDDVDAFIEAIEEAKQLRDPFAFAHLNVHVPLELLKEENETVLRSLLASIQEYVDDGTAVWDTQLGAFEAYEDWKN